MSTNPYPLIIRDGKVKRQHRVIANYMLNGLLDKHPEYVVHHIDNNIKNNNPSNLMILKNDDVHKRLHRSQKALEVCGNADWWRCHYCGEYDDLKNLNLNGHSYIHSSCKRKNSKEYRLKKKRGG